MKGVLNHASVVFTLILAAFYALGLNFHLSFLKEFGIEETQFPLSIDRVFYQGFFAIAQLTAPTLGFAVLCAAGVLATCYIALALFEFAKRTDFTNKILLKLESIKKKKPAQLKSSETLISLTDFATKVYLFLCTGIVVYISILSIIAAAELAGRDLAKSYKDKIDKKEVALDTLVVEREKGQLDVYKGYSIICNTQQCAYFDGEKSSVFNHSSVKSLKSTPPGGES
ncbi:MAG: hypothetical protein ACPGR2_06295 [Psychrobium sp.]